MISYSDAELAALEADVVSKGVFFRMATSPVTRLWLGFGDIAPGVNVLDPSDGGTYLGFGEIQDIPVYKQLLNGAAERVEFTMNGVSGNVLALAAADSDQVIGAAVDVGFMLFGPDWAPLGPVHWLAHYVAGPISLRQQLNEDATKPPMRTLSLSAGSLFTSRRRPSYSYFTDSDQQARAPGDLFCSLAAQYTTEFNLPWPIYT